MKENLKSQIELCLNTSGNQRCMLSDIDHALTPKDNQYRLEYVSEIEEKDLDGLDTEIQIYIAALIEYIYNINKITPPIWVKDSKYTLADISDNRIYKYLRELFKLMSDEQFHKLMESELRKSVPEFRWRNMICDGIFDSY